MIFQRNIILLTISLTVLLSANIRPITAKEQEEQEVIAGSDAKITLTYNGQREGIAIILKLLRRGKKEGERIAFVNKDFKMLSTGDGIAFMKKRGLTVKGISAVKFELTVPKVEVDDEGLGLQCTGYTDGGVGSLVYTRKLVLKVIEPPKIKVEPESNLVIINVGRNSSKDVIISCIASGRPKPTVTWKRKNSTSPLDSTAMNSTAMGGRVGAQLRLKAPIEVKDDGNYVCTAKVDSARLRETKKAEAEETVNVSVQYKPTLKIENKVIYTDLNETESLKIDVSGNPRPKLNCSMLSLPEPKTIRLTPDASHHRLVYEVTILKVNQADVREYNCVAWNALGRVSETVLLTLVPSEVEVLSGNKSSFSDYYQLHWKVRSRAQLHNVTVEVHVRNDSYSKLVRTDSFNLAGSARSFRHHIVNLTENTMHELRVKACNTRGCGPVKKAVLFRTQQYDGSNTVDPNILNIPVTVPPPRSNQVRGRNGAASKDPMTVSLLAFSGIMIALVTH